MNKFMNWLQYSFEPKASKLVSKPTLSAISSAMQKILPFILTGSLVFLHNAIRSFITFLPNIDIILNYSFGLLGLIISFNLSNQIMEKLGQPRYTIVSGIVSIAVFIMFCNPTFDEAGNFIVPFNRFGATGIVVGMIAGGLVSFIFVMFAKLKLLHNNMSIPDFVSEWINQVIPIVLSIGTAAIVTQILKVNVFNVIISIFMPIQSFGQTLPGFLLLIFLPVLFYSVGISPWIFFPIQAAIYYAAADANVVLASQGQNPIYIATFETVSTTSLISMGGMGATLALNIMMLFSKSKKLNVMGKICILPSFFNINEPLMYGAPVVMNPILMLPLWINTIIGPIVVWFVMKFGLLKIPTKIVFGGQIPAPFSTIMITEDMRALIWYFILLVVYFIIWMPFYKVYEKQCIAEETNAN